MKKQNISELDMLFEEIGTYKDSCEFKDLLQFVKRFHRVAPYNAMLLHVQKPGSTYVATGREWERTFNRGIKAGARPLVILRPFGPVSFVFELGDTEGTKPFPQKLLNPFETEGELSGINYDRLVENLKSDGILYVEAEYGTNSAGFIQTSTKKVETKISRVTKEIWVEILYEMVVNRTHKIETRFATILHELGHLYCGHLGTPFLKWWEDRHNLSKNIMEFEAECVCWLICERMGIHNPSAEYLNSYLDNNERIPSISLDIVLKSVGKIEKMIKEKIEPRKEIVKKVIDLKSK